MFPILVSLGSAILFALFAYGTYGLEGVTAQPWVGMVFWALIGSGMLVFLVNRRLSCRLCRRLRPRLPPLARFCTQQVTC